MKKLIILLLIFSINASAAPYFPVTNMFDGDFDTYYMAAKEKCEISLDFPEKIYGLNILFSEDTIPASAEIITKDGKSIYGLRLHKKEGCFSNVI